MEICKDMEKRELLWSPTYTPLTIGNNWNCLTAENSAAKQQNPLVETDDFTYILI